MSSFQVGDYVEVNDPKRPWADGEVGTIIGQHPPNAEEPESYELVVAGRPLRTTSDKLKEATE